MRVPGIGTDMFIDRDVERDCMIQAAKVGVGPAVAYQIDPEGALVIDFVEGEIMHPETMAGHPDRIRQAVETVKVFHDRARLQATRSSSSTCCASTRRSPATSTRRCRSGSRRCSWRWRTWRRRRSANPVPAVACHNDLLSENFIIDADGKMWIIDWEYGGMTDPYFDLGDYVMEHPFSREEERLIIETYCGEMDERLLRPHDALQERLRPCGGACGR